MPAIAAQYVSLIARAVPGMFSEDEILYHLPQERGWAYAHSLMVDQGVKTHWPDARNPLVKWWADIRQRFNGGKH